MGAMRAKPLILGLLLLSICFGAQGQFRRELSTNTGTFTNVPGAADPNNPQVTDSTAVAIDSTAGFSLKKLIRGYARKDTLPPAYMFAGAVVVPGAAQMYNRDWWKLPILYTGIGAGIGGGIYFNGRWKATGDARFKTWRNLSYAGAGLFYWASLLDGVVCYETGMRSPVPVKSTLYSALLPGLGQANNGDWWKIPIWVGGFVACGYAYHLNNMEYQRFRYLYTVASDPTSGYYGAVSGSQAEWYKDLYRKYRDYSVLAFAVVYILQIIDANVFAYMADFDVSDNLASVRIEPTILNPEYSLLAASGSPLSPSLGLKLNLNF